jgi:hypothetical protein
VRHRKWAKCAKADSTFQSPEESHPAPVSAVKHAMRQRAENACFRVSMHSMTNLNRLGRLSPVFGIGGVGDVNDRMPSR